MDETKIKIGDIVRIDFGDDSWTGRKFGDYKVVGVNTWPCFEIKLLPVEKNMPLALWYKWEESCFTLL